MTEPTELLPCPFCGGINIIHCGHHMYCHAFGADGPDADSQHESEAITAWNTRTPQPTQPQPVAREPLTDEQIRAVEPWIFDTAKQWVRLIEAAHGIKGGQHGADTRSN